MRARLLTDRVVVAPGGVATFEIEVFNDADVIDGIGVQVVGVDPGWVTVDPARLALFPDAAGTVHVAVALAGELPAGDLPVTLVVQSRVQAAPVHIPAVVAIEPTSFSTMAIQPSGVRGRREAEATVVVENRGNHPVDVVLAGEDSERLITITVSPAVLTVAPGERVEAEVHLRGPRHVLGSPIMRPYTIRGTVDGGELVATGTFNQEALLPRGVATAAILLAIIALWAVVAVVAIGLVLGEDALTKAVPASFRDPEVALATGAASATKGLDVRTVGGVLSGAVNAATDGRGVPRMKVEALRQTRDGPVLASATASDEEGAFTVVGLLPGSYTLRFSAPGYDDVWYPGVPAAAQAEPIRVTALAEPEPLSLEVAGQPGTLTGRVDVGQTTAELVVGVTVRPVIGGVRGNPVSAGPTDGDGRYTISALPTPASYELTFDAPGFQPQSIVVDLDGGQVRTVNTVRMATGLGSLSGQITDGTEALGGVTVTATGGGQTYETATPTAGAVGIFVLADLPTPGTYLVSFAREGYSTETIAVELGPGEHASGLQVTLTGGTGTVSGLVTAVGQGGLGDVVVTVTGTGGVEIATATVTAGAVGSWQVTGLPTPGRYAVTFSRPGYASETRSVELAPSGSATGVDVTLSRALGDLEGTVRGPGGGGLGGAEISVTDGLTVRATRSANSPPGAYQLLDLPPGPYAVTVTAPGHAPYTTMVEIRPGVRSQVDVTLEAGP